MTDASRNALQGALFDFESILQSLIDEGTPLAPLDEDGRRLAEEMIKWARRISRELGTASFPLV